MQRGAVFVSERGPRPWRGWREAASVDSHSGAGMNVRTIFDQMGERYITGKVSQTRVYYFSIGDFRATVTLRPEALLNAAARRCCCSSLMD